APTLAAISLPVLMSSSLPAGGRWHWQQSLTDGLDALVSRLLSLCKPIPAENRCLQTDQAQAISSASNGRGAPFQPSVFGRRADRGGAALRRWCRRRGARVDRRRGGRGRAGRVCACVPRV